MSRSKPIGSLPVVEPAGTVQDLRRSDSPWPVNVPLKELRQRVSKESGECYSYVMISFQLDETDQGLQFRQRGSAPNFAGGVLTLCTCKHRMRASRAVEDWSGVWLAGFTSRTLHEGRNWLTYLARVQKAYASHAKLWQSLSDDVRDAKAADKHYLGDIFRPRPTQPFSEEPYNPDCYRAPKTGRHSHAGPRAPEEWHNDIRYLHQDRYGPAALLVADPQQTFVWDMPQLALRGKHSRSYRRLRSTNDLLDQLETP